MASLTVEQRIKLMQVLADAGMGSDLAEIIIRKPGLAGGMVAWLRGQLAPPLPELFASLEVQLANVRRWNAERNWGFTDADFGAIDLTPASHSGLVVDVIAVYLPGQGKTSGVQRTFEELWDIASSVQPHKWRYRALKSDPKHLRLLNGIEHTPGIRRVTLDLGAYWDTTNGIRPVDVCGKDSAHAEILAAAAHFPDWVRAMDGERVPNVWLPGYQATMTIPSDEVWGGVPSLYWRSAGREVGLSAFWDDCRRYYSACPVVVRRES
jgi:hypothetical protein